MNPGCKWVAWSSLSRMGQKLSRRVLSRIKHSFSCVPTARSFSHEQHGVLTSMCVPHETILEIHVSECHRHMIQHKKNMLASWRNTGGKSSTTWESFTGWWFSTPPIDTTQWNHIQYLGMETEHIQSYCNEVKWTFNLYQTCLGYKKS